MANNRLTVGCYRADSRLLQPASRSPPRSLPVASARGRALLRDQGCGSCSRKIASHLATATRTPPGPRRLFARERENVAQEGFDAPVHRISPPHRLSA
jgi:hypothetical protein